MTMTNERPLFDGPNDEGDAAEPRLRTQLQRTYDALRPGYWFTLSALARTVNAPTSSVSARIRDLRKDRWGGNVIERRITSPGSGIYEYCRITRYELLDGSHTGPSPKLEARERITAFLDVWGVNLGVVASIRDVGGARHVLTVADLRELLR